MKKILSLLLMLVVFMSLIGCSVIEEGDDLPSIGGLTSTENATTDSETNQPTSADEYTIEGDTFTYAGKSYEIIEVDGGDRSGDREANVAVDIGFGDRVYWALTNEYGQLVYVLADEIILQDDDVEPVNDDGRYYHDEANVPGTEHPDLDQGHVIADSLGGVANAYNITPQDSTMNRHGDQAYMEEIIRDAGGVTDFFAIITYPDTRTQTPSHYKFEYNMMGNIIVDDFANVNPDEYNEALFGDNSSEQEDSTSTPDNIIEGDISTIDTNNNGQVSAAEAEAAGFEMPISSEHWLYAYMTDGDGDGFVGE